jgi:hypothetical protein
MWLFISIIIVIFQLILSNIDEILSLQISFSNNNKINFNKRVHSNKELRLSLYDIHSTDAIINSISLSYAQLNSIHLDEILNKAITKALDGGTAGASASFFQVVSLMWLRYHNYLSSPIKNLPLSLFFH